MLELYGIVRGVSLSGKMKSKSGGITGLEGHAEIYTIQIFENDLEFICPGGFNFWNSKL